MAESTHENPGESSDAGAGHDTTGDTSEPVDEAIRLYTTQHGSGPSFVARAPGRVNLIGEHTDYNDGFVLPMALPFATAIAARAGQGSGVVEVESSGYGRAQFLAGEVPDDLPTWARYVAGVGHILCDEGFELRGWSGTIATDIPMGASLSSSAALEIATILAFATASGFDVDRTHAARMAQRVENEIMGYQTGIMDQFISATASRGHASLIDCRSLTSEPAPVPATVVVFDTMSRRELVDTEYDLRRASCERAAAAIGVDALRDATIGQLELVTDPTDRRRAEHVLAENDRTLAAVAAMRGDNPAELGQLMNASHTSLRDLYEVSGPELDIAVDIAQQVAGCYGARMTGGGFAGCCVALVADDQKQAFMSSASHRFASDTGVTPRAWACEPSAGASVLVL